MVVRTTSADFSKIAYDQKHEQNNNDIKATSGYINLVNKKDDSFLQKLELCSSEIHQFLEKTKQKQVFDQKHKEKLLAFNSNFLSHCNTVYSKMNILE